MAHNLKEEVEHADMLEGSLKKSQTSFQKGMFTENLNARHNRRLNKYAQGTTANPRDYRAWNEMDVSMVPEPKYRGKNIYAFNGANLNAMRGIEDAGYKIKNFKDSVSPYIGIDKPDSTEIISDENVRKFIENNLKRQREYEESNKKKPEDESEENIDLNEDIDLDDDESEEERDERLRKELAGLDNSSKKIAPPKRSLSGAEKKLTLDLLDMWDKNTKHLPAFYYRPLGYVMSPVPYLMLNKEDQFLADWLESHTIPSIVTAVAPGLDAVPSAPVKEEINSEGEYEDDEDEALRNELAHAEKTKLVHPEDILNARTHLGLVLSAYLKDIYENGEEKTSDRYQLISKLARVNVNRKNQLASQVQFRAVWEFKDFITNFAKEHEGTQIGGILSKLLEASQKGDYHSLKRVMNSFQNKALPFYQALFNQVKDIEGKSDEYDFKKGIAHFKNYLRAFGYALPAQKELYWSGDNGTNSSALTMECLFMPLYLADNASEVPAVAMRVYDLAEEYGCDENTLGELWEELNSKRVKKTLSSESAEGGEYIKAVLKNVLNRLVAKGADGLEGLREYIEKSDPKEWDEKVDESDTFVELWSEDKGTQQYMKQAMHYLDTIRDTNTVKSATEMLQWVEDNKDEVQSIAQGIGLGSKDQSFLEKTLSEMASWGLKSAYEGDENSRFSIFEHPLYKAVQDAMYEDKRKEESERRAEERESRLQQNARVQYGADVDKPKGYVLTDQDLENNTDELVSQAYDRGQTLTGIGDASTVGGNMGLKEYAWDRLSNSINRFKGIARDYFDLKKIYSGQVNALADLWKYAQSQSDPVVPTSVRKAIEAILSLNDIGSKYKLGKKDFEYLSNAWNILTDFKERASTGQLDTGSTPPELQEILDKVDTDYRMSPVDIFNWANEKRMYKPAARRKMIADAVRNLLFQVDGKGLVKDEEGNPIFKELSDEDRYKIWSTFVGPLENPADALIRHYVKRGIEEDESLKQEARILHNDRLKAKKVRYNLKKEGGAGASADEVQKWEAQIQKREEIFAAKRKKIIDDFMSDLTNDINALVNSKQISLSEGARNSINDLLEEKDYNKISIKGLVDAIAGDLERSTPLVTEENIQSLKDTDPSKYLLMRYLLSPGKSATGKNAALPLIKDIIKSKEENGNLPYPWQDNAFKDDLKKRFDEVYPKEMGNKLAQQAIQTLFDPKKHGINEMNGTGNVLEDVAAVLDQLDRLEPTFVYGGNVYHMPSEDDDGEKDHYIDEIIAPEDWEKFNEKEYGTIKQLMPIAALRSNMAKDVFGMGMLNKYGADIKPNADSIMTPDKVFARDLRGIYTQDLQGGLKMKTDVATRSKKISEIREIQDMFQKLDELQNPSLDDPMREKYETILKGYAEIYPMIMNKDGTFKAPNQVMQDIFYNTDSNGAKKYKSDDQILKEMVINGIRRAGMRKGNNDEVNKIIEEYLTNSNNVEKLKELKAKFGDKYNEQPEFGELVSGANL